MLSLIKNSITNQDLNNFYKRTFDLSIFMYRYLALPQFTFASDRNIKSKMGGVDP